MTPLDYVVLVVYFLVMAGIGLASMLRIKRQEDFFLGGRGFGKLLQAFAAFGAGTGSQDPVTTGRTTYTSGLSGIWSVLLWLFVTPFYWFFGVWYRRMRHLTLGDWFVERFQSRGLGAAFAVYGFVFFMAWLGVGFSAVGKVCAPLIGSETFHLPWMAAPVAVEHVLVPVIALVVMIYGVLGGLRAAYWTDLIQGVFIIVLSVLLIPAGLNALVERFGDAQTMGTLDGFRVMHEQVPGEYFEIVETPKGGEFPLHYIVAITLLNLVGIVVQPHLIAIGGGSAKTETTARVGLVIGTFMKRFCTVGWALTALIILALLADNVELAEDPDQVWGVAAREILGPFNLGLVGLMLACLVAALMSSADCYMLIASGLLVRNGYAAYLNRNADEKTYITAGRLAGVAVIAGGVLFSMWLSDVLEQLKIAWELPIIFAAPFWVGMFWRGATRLAAWLTVAFSALAFFVVPIVLPMAVRSLAEDPRYAATNEIVTTIVTRPAAPADVARRNGAIALWKQNVGNWTKQKGPQSQEAVHDRFGPCPKALELGESLEDRFTTGGKPIYWKEKVEPINRDGEVLRFTEEGKVTAVVREGKNGPFEIPVAEDHEEYVLEEVERVEKGNTLEIRRRFRGDCRLRGEGSFNLDFLIYDALGVPLTEMSNPALETLRLPTRVVLPFVVMILLSLITPRVDRQALSRYYVKMKTPVNPDPAADKAELEASYRDPSRFDDRRLFPVFGLEVQKPKRIDLVGFLVGFLVCFAIIGFTIWVAKLGS